MCKFVFRETEVCPASMATLIISKLQLSKFCSIILLIQKIIQGRKRYLIRLGLIEERTQ